MTKSTTLVAIAVGSSFFLCLSGFSQDESRTRTTVDFARDVQPIFEKHCYECHGSSLQESNFRLDVRKTALGTADLGTPPIVPGRSNQSPLIRFVSGRDEEHTMPPVDEGEPLTAEQVNVLRRWIDEGTSWPDELAGESTVTLTTDHWSFQPVAELQPPEIKSQWIKNGIDPFILEKLEDAGLESSSAADRVTLIRRIYLDMHGILPTIDQVREFVEDDSPDADTQLINRVLESSHYGERWARHWLDVVRFGESTGYEVNRDRPNAYYYRDYVIDALNEDKSYRDFIIEQIAGDALGVDAATGFLVGGPYDLVKSPDINLTLMQRQDELADYVQTTSTAFLGLTVGCARCHNHKFDPILQKDYYAMQAVFAGVEHGERRLRGTAFDEHMAKLDSARADLKDRETHVDELRNAASQHGEDEILLPPVNARMNVEKFAPIHAKLVRFTIYGTNGSEPCIDELEVYSATKNENVVLASRGTTATSSGDFPNNPLHKLAHINDGKYGNSRSWISNQNGKGWVQLELPATVEIDRVVWGRDRQERFRDRLAIDYVIEAAAKPGEWTQIASSSRRQPFGAPEESEEAFISHLSGEQASAAREAFDQLTQLREKTSALEKAIPVAYIGKFKTPEKIHRLHRGDPMSRREEVGPDTLTVAGSLDLARDADEQDRRLALANWIASPDNPLTARVIVNRVWHYHFGRGIVATPSDFGKNGTPPSHARLLDWLSKRFMENGWSLKWLHREVLSSSTYQQSSKPRAEAVAIDASSRLLWRFPPRRLEAEAIRDCVLQATGKLNPKAGGPGFPLLRIDHENVHHYFPIEEFGPEQFRRMIYMTKIRQEQDDVFGIFDCPDGGQVMPDRSRSTTPLQALNLLNSKFMTEQAAFLAERLRDHDQRVDEQIRHAFLLLFSREPSDEERNESRQLVEEYGLDSFCRALLNTNEFLFVS